MPARIAITLILAATCALAGACEDSSPAVDAAISRDGRPADSAPRDAPAADVAADAPSAPGWQLRYRETFEGAPTPTLSWSADTAPDDGPFSDNGKFFADQNISAPAAFRATRAFGQDGWLTVEAYSRSDQTAPSEMFSFTSDPDPSASGNRVMRLRSPAHSDAIVVRPSVALPARYRISLRVGYADFGDGKAGKNGYDGGEKAGPWNGGSATSDNGFYWLAILDAPPRPHNNVWIHHHRKLVIDSDNHYPASWMQIWDGSQFVVSGEHPVMMFALDGLSKPSPWVGHEFLSWSAGKWHDSGQIRAADSYKAERWYSVTIERKDDVFTLTVSGDFEHGGQQSYGGSVDAKARCIYHYNRDAASQDSRCANTGTFSQLPGRPHWPRGSAYPDYFMFGDPHVNYYEGTVYFDDIQLEVWR